MKARLPVRAAILKRKTYEAPAEGRAGKIRLDFNENTTGCGPAVLRALAKLTPQQFAMYPEYQKPTARIARHLGVRHRANFLLTNGGDDALRVFFDTFVEPRSHILICEPTFPMYRYYAEIAGARIDVCRYDPQQRFPLERRSHRTSQKAARIFPGQPQQSNWHAGRARSAAKNSASRSRYRRRFRRSLRRIFRLLHHCRGFVVTRISSSLAHFPKPPDSPRFASAPSSPQRLLSPIVRRAMPPFPVNLAALVAAEAALRERKTIRAYVRKIRRTRESFAARFAKTRHRTPSRAREIFFSPTLAQPVPRFSPNSNAKAFFFATAPHDMGPGFVRITIGTRQK